jgi:hypothetical protein
MRRQVATLLYRRLVEVGELLWERFTMLYAPETRRLAEPAEIEISLFARQCLGERKIPSLGQRRETSAWNRKMDRDRAPSIGNSRAKKSA